ncbi:MAG: HNH endonuclease, partial [Cytophagaceae bacterium]
GPLSPRWNGGIGKYRGRNWGKQKEAAAKRDKYTCQLCGEFKGSAVHIHHIRPFSLFDDSVKANALSNLVALCASCHASAEGHTDNADVTNWKEAYEEDKKRVLGETQRIADALGKDIRCDYLENGFTRMQCLEKYRITEGVFRVALYRKRERRGQSKARDGV